VKALNLLHDNEPRRTVRKHHIDYGDLHVGFTVQSCSSSFLRVGLCHTHRPAELDAANGDPLTSSENPVMMGLVLDGVH
jgi:hypothetical protein